MKIKEEFKKRIDAVLDEVKDWAEWKSGKTGFEDKYNVEPKQKWDDAKELMDKFKKK